MGPERDHDKPNSEFGGAAQNADVFVGKVEIN
jgi:hypothetical protein